MDRLEKEYREFGPWILELKTEEDVPDLFRKYYSFNDSVDIAIKIPVPMDRRKARKGMAFYKSIISFNREDIIILNKEESGISEEILSYKNIKAIKNMVDLLEAELTIFTETKEYTVKYSSVSEDIMNKALELLRNKITEKSGLYKFKEEYNEDIAEPLFRNLINILNKKKIVKTVFYQKTIPVKKNNPGILDFLLFNFNLELQSHIFLRTEKELIAINRNKEIKKRRAVDYSYNYTYIPFSNIKSAEFIPDPDFPDIYYLDICLKNSSQLKFRTYRETEKYFREIAAVCQRQDPQYQ